MDNCEWKILKGKLVEKATNRKEPGIERERERGKFMVHQSEIETSEREIIDNGTLLSGLKRNIKIVNHQFGF